MDLVIDANIIMSALIATEGKTYDLILNDGIKLASPDKLAEELEKHKLEILEKSGLSEYDFNLFLSIISHCRHIFCRALLCYAMTTAFRISRFRII